MEAVLSGRRCRTARGPTDGRSADVLLRAPQTDKKPLPSIGLLPFSDQLATLVFGASTTSPHPRLCGNSLFPPWHTIERSNPHHGGATEDRDGLAPTGRRGCWDVPRFGVGPDVR